MNVLVSCVRCHRPFTLFGVQDAEKDRMLKCKECGTEWRHVFTPDELASVPETPQIVKIAMQESQAKRIA